MILMIKKLLRNLIERRTDFFLLNSANCYFLLEESAFINQKETDKKIKCGFKEM